MSRDLYKKRSDITKSISDNHVILLLHKEYSIKFENIQKQKIIDADVKTIFAALTGSPVRNPMNNELMIQIKRGHTPKFNPLPRDGAPKAEERGVRRKEYISCSNFSKPNCSGSSGDQTVPLNATIDPRVNEAVIVPKPIRKLFIPFLASKSEGINLSRLLLQNTDKWILLVICRDYADRSSLRIPGANRTYVKLRSRVNILTPTGIIINISLELSGCWR
ncbi:MAG: hypothetical protein QXU28_01335 [Nitrososphaerota archaeon]